ncbi:uncharacterized protein [Physcomitrium patens]|uniref:FLZ-type domain-containing protein n=1 Tax=Physcomitrium patens TaxID=3218 RepID=A9TZZ9_PHYPA|nr:uncharacterized protein LOC112277427 [Physcomitrium patens]PNR27243.1 hypothetical protein PHYPA_029395 [Physcomitrium patens]|eukprot:XP_024365466.1 uncharacterized protein LOC112277427 [Physcomitrella patens]
MTGKRPRALTRTASVSQLGSGNLSQEFSPLPENPKEKLKPTIKDPPSCAPRVVIGFDPKPASAQGPSYSECGGVSPKSSPCSPCFQDKASSPRSALNSLFSRQPRCVKPSDGVGLGIVLHAHSPAPVLFVEDIKTSINERSVEAADHISIPVREDISPQRYWDIPVVQSRRHSHPIPTPGISPCHFSNQITNHQHPENRPVMKGPKHHQEVRPILGWMEQDTLKVDRRDTFLLAASPARGSLVVGDDTAALTATTHFLDECSFCKRHLPEDKDIFMYRGDKAFCSVECRSQQMLMDERSKNCSSSALKRGPVMPSRRSVAPASSVAAA